MKKLSCDRAASWPLIQSLSTGDLPPRGWIYVLDTSGNSKQGLLLNTTETNGEHSYMDKLAEKPYGGNFCA